MADAGRCAQPALCHGSHKESMHTTCQWCPPSDQYHDQGIPNLPHAGEHLADGGESASPGQRHCGGLLELTEAGLRHQLGHPDHESLRQTNAVSPTVSQVACSCLSASAATLRAAQMSGKSSSAYPVGIIGTCSEPQLRPRCAFRNSDKSPDLCTWYKCRRARWYSRRSDTQGAFAILEERCSLTLLHVVSGSAVG